MQPFEKNHETAHYIFRFHENSIAEKEIRHITDTQEACFTRITRQLGIPFPMKIEYFLCDTPDEVGEHYGDGEPCNGFARMPHQVYAVYNEKVRCIGPHEDTHLISYQINRPPSCFLREGLAMYFDGVWWGLSNDLWSKYYLEEGHFPAIQNLLEDDFFFSLPCEYTYPIAGSFAAWIFSAYSQETYMDIYRAKDNLPARLEGALRLSLSDIDARFRAHLAALPLDEHARQTIQRELKEA